MSFHTEGRRLQLDAPSLQACQVVPQKAEVDKAIAGWSVRNWRLVGNI